MLNLFLIAVAVVLFMMVLGAELTLQNMRRTIQEKEDLINLLRTENNNLQMFETQTSQKLSEANKLILDLRSRLPR